MRTLLALLAVAISLSGQDFENLKIEKAVAGRKFADGPIWVKEGYLMFTDVPTNQVWKFVPGEGSAVVRENSNGAAGQAVDAQGRFYLCESHTRRIIRIDRRGKTEVLAERWQGKKFNAPNDITVRYDGHAYFTDPAFGSANEQRELDFYGVYHIGPKGELTLVAKPTGRPNGITLSPNGRTLYVSNADEKNIRAYDLDKNGEPSNERILVKGIDGVPNGLRTDEKGNLYCAARAVEIYSAEGKSIRQIKLAEEPSNLSFGDGDLATLFVTAHTSVFRIRLGVKGATPYQRTSP